MNWAAFALANPELAKLGEERFERTGLLLLGTLRRNGFPRISPVEPLLCDGELELGMMWRSPKALDLLRDPRCVVHNTVSNRDGKEGDFKAYGRAVEIRDLDARRRYCDALFAKIGWKPDEPEFHLFALDIENVGYVVFDQGKSLRKTWAARGQP